MTDKLGGPKCFECGARPAPFGFRRQGISSQLPTGKRGVLWACAEHRDAARARKEAAEK